MGAPVPVRAGDRKAGDEAEPLVVGPITRTHIVRYAGASGNFTPIHHDEELAQQVGLPAVFTMGMLQGGMLAHLVADWLGLANVRRFGIRFEERVWPGDELTFTATVALVDVAREVERVTAELASYDVDVTSMAVEAAHAALRSAAGEVPAPRQVLLATANPPYLDKVIGAMKMEHTAASAAGTVTELPVAPGQQVETGSVLAVVDNGEGGGG